MYGNMNVKFVYNKFVIAHNIHCASYFSFPKFH